MAVKINQAPSNAALALGYSGLIPFFSGAALAAFGPSEIALAAHQLTLLYGGLILSFLGGINWGLFVMVDENDRKTAWLVTGVLPSLIALVALGFGGVVVIAILVAGFAFILADHYRIAAKLGLPDWFIGLRRNLTIGATLSIVSLAL